MSGLLLTLFGAAGSPNVSYAVNVGQFVNGNNYIYGFYSTYGSVSPTTFSNTGTPIYGIYWSYNDRAGLTNFIFTLAGAASQSIFTSISVSGQTFTSASANFNAFVSQTQWTWFTTANPFPTIGANVAVNFT